MTNEQDSKMAEGAAPRVNLREAMLTHPDYTGSEDGAPLADEVDVALFCGHTARFHVASSQWDFPHDKTWCDTCKCLQHLNGKLILKLDEENSARRAALRPITKKTTRGTYSRMRIVRWDGGSPIKQDRDGNLWKCYRLYGQNKIELEAVQS